MDHHRLGLTVPSTRTMPDGERDNRSGWHAAVRVPVARGEAIAGDLVVPAGATGVVVFAHGSGSSRHSPRNRQVAARLHEARLATLLVDLLSPGEEALDRRTRELRFDIGLLARRLAAAVARVRDEPSLQDLPVGYFGASTGAAAALVAAADRPDGIGAVVSRGGRPDLAGDRLADVAAPTLLIVGGADTTVLDLNRRAAGRMRGEVAVEVVPGAGHLFEEPGALAAVADVAALWFGDHLAVPDRGRGVDR
jgi:putative phosphoribosyl transferase